jgi:hypothetical protein
MSSTAVQGQTDRGIHRRVEHIMGMLISLALRGRHTATTKDHQAWQEVINQGNPAGLTARAHLRRSTGRCNRRSGARRRVRGAAAHPRHHLCTRRPLAPAPSYGFSEAAVVTIGGLGGALVAWGLSVIARQVAHRSVRPGTLGDRRICWIRGRRGARPRGRTDGCRARQRSYVRQTRRGRAPRV